MPTVLPLHRESANKQSWPIATPEALPIFKLTTSTSLNAASFDGYKVDQCPINALEIYIKTKTYQVNGSTDTQRMCKIELSEARSKIGQLIGNIAVAV